jgi:hypothetical protein
LSDERPVEEIPGFEGLSEELERALERVRRAAEELPPLEELAGFQGTMEGLSQVGSLVGRMQLAEQQEASAVHEMVGRPDWRMDSRIRVSREHYPTAILELRADFDLDGLVENRAATDGEMIAGESPRPSAVAVMREFKVQGTSKFGPGEEVEGRSAVVPAPHIPVELNADGQVCSDLAPVVAMGLSAGDLASSSGLEDVSLQTALRRVRVPLDRFQERKPFRRSRESRSARLELSIRLSFAPLGGPGNPP